SGDDEEEAVSPELMTEKYVRALPGAVPSTLDLSLVCARHSLWGHRLWNAAIVLAEMIDSSEISVAGKKILELGAGAGLPGLICALNGAAKVVISDYATPTDQNLLVPIKMNIERLQPAFVPRDTLHGVGHVWGQSVEDLLAPVSRHEHKHKRSAGEGDDPAHSYTAGETEGGGEVENGANNGLCHVDENVVQSDESGFDVLVLADLLFNRSQHAQLLETCSRCLARSEMAEVWVSFSHHDPEKAALDMKFFELASLRGFVSTHIKTVSLSPFYHE
ncbi:unnamed protein product, partial [Sphacelaria rigidula]